MPVCSPHRMKLCSSRFELLCAFSTGLIAQMTTTSRVDRRHRRRPRDVSFAPGGPAGHGGPHQRSPVGQRLIPLRGQQARGQGARRGREGRGDGELQRAAVGHERGARRDRGVARAAVGCAITRSARSKPRSSSHSRRRGIGLQSGTDTGVSLQLLALAVKGPPKRNGCKFTYIPQSVPGVKGKTCYSPRSRYVQPAAVTAAPPA
jgi:hypothetical protein